MYFIHGGGFAFGDSVLYGPSRLLQEDVVLVVIHYRLGAFGKAKLYALVQFLIVDFLLCAE